MLRITKKDHERAQRALRNLRCPHCGYGVHGLPTNQCPECGKDFSWDELQLQLEGRPLRGWRRHLGVSRHTSRLFWFGAPCILAHTLALIYAGARSIIRSASPSARLNLRSLNPATARAIVLIMLIGFMGYLLGQWWDRRDTMREWAWWQKLLTIMLCLAPFAAYPFIP